MKKLNVTKVLIIISVIIMVLGIIIGVGVFNSTDNSISNESIYVDGSDFSGIVQIGGVIGSKILGTLIVFGSFIIDAFIWLIYGVVVLVIDIAKKISKKRVVPNE